MARRPGRLPAAVVIAVAALLTGCGGHAGGARPVALRVTSSGFADGPVAIDIRGLQAGRRVTLHARWTAFGGHPWTSSTPLCAGPGGAIRLRGLAAARPLWAMRPVGAAFEHPFFFPPARGPSTAAFSVTVGGRTVARATLARRITPPTIRTRRLTPVSYTHLTLPTNREV